MGEHVTLNMAAVAVLFNSLLTQIVISVFIKIIAIMFVLINKSKKRGDKITVCESTPLV